MGSLAAVARTTVRPRDGMSHRLPHRTSCDRTCAHLDRDGLSASNLAWQLVGPHPPSLFCRLLARQGWPPAIPPGRYRALDRLRGRHHGSARWGPTRSGSFESGWHLPHLGCQPLPFIALAKSPLDLRVGRVCRIPQQLTPAIASSSSERAPPAPMEKAEGSPQPGSSPHTPAPSYRAA